jgi:uncharacterized protein YceK
MKTALIAVVTVIGAVSLSGCGTVCNLAGGIVHPDNETRVYGGVILDLEVIDAAVSGKKTFGGGPGAVVVLLPLAVLDPMLSLIADTLTLPFTIPLQAKRNAANTCDVETDLKGNDAFRDTCQSISGQ